MSKKTRLDVALVEQGLFPSREQAQRAVMAGQVKLGDQVLSKSSFLVAPDAELSVVASPKYVGRGGIVADPALHEKAKWKIEDFVAAQGHVSAGITPSRITGMDGNQEFFICARKQSA
jgi:23S rRNA (cytidine1920-2'-O)/16S rRNA (cytidine1409-2'-O)-methyltransferase